MEKKYIVKLDDNKLAYTAIIIDGVPYIKPLQLLPYTEPDLDAVRNEAYEQGVIYGRMCEREKIFKTLEKFSDDDTDFDRLTMGDFRTIMELNKHLQKMKETDNG